MPTGAYIPHKQFALRMVTVHEKTRYKSKIAILDNAHLKVQTLCYFITKPDLPNGDKLTSVWVNAILFSAFCSSLFTLISSAETYFSQKNLKQLTASVVKKDPKTHKRLKENFLIRRNRTKCANFRGNPLFQATYNMKTGKQTIQLTLCQLDVGG